ncbi:hypothetical protein JKP88DRAFT_243941 [Tribonema minus]|uniref:DUF559 domain-containing protein n=1 Tax=Tribonema minus TaxID=303371 RepID=A0A835Z871_9STRA|nr:hypothetical protein JKP88DRAFT_243941 [Tribonema minus]
MPPVDGNSDADDGITRGPIKRVKPSPDVIDSRSSTKSTEGARDDLYEGDASNKTSGATHHVVTFACNGVCYRVRKLTEGNELLFDAADMGSLLGLSNIREIIRYFTSEEKTKRRVPTPRGCHMKTMWTNNGVRKLVCRSRKPNAALLAKNLGIDVYSNHYMTEEADTLSFLMQAFDGEEIYTQYAVGPYVIDMYFPRVKLAIECDEESHHKRSNVEADLRRQRHIEELLGCSFIRYRPQKENFSMAALVNAVWLKLR